MKKLSLILISILLILTLAACGDKCEHTYDNACDAICNECGETREISAHDYAAATCTAPKTCKICGATEGEALGHTWTNATCTTPKTCSVCGATDGNALGHTPAEDDGDCTTPITCSVCGTTTTPANDNHAGGTATCTEKAKCTACGTAYGELDPDNHIDENTDHICDRSCGKTDIGTHADSNEDNDHVCDYGCGVTLNNHEGGTQICKGYECTVCGEWYGNPLSHNYTYTPNQANYTVTESCDQGCGHTATVTLKAPEGAVYNGQKHEAYLGIEGESIGKYEITYHEDPIGVGQHTAWLYVNTEGDTWEEMITVLYQIEKATPTVTAPTASTLTYNGEAQQLVSAGSANLGTMVYSLTEDGTFTTDIPTATNAGGYTVYYYVKGNNNVNDSEKASVTVNIAKATPTYTAPMGLTATYGDTLEDVVLNTATGNTAGAWTWNDGDTTSVGNAGTQIFKATFTPTDSTNYNTVEVELTIAVAKATVTVTANAQSKTCGDVDPKLTYEVSGLMGSDNQNDVLTGDLTREAGEIVGVYAITQGFLTANGNYTIAFTGAEFVINQKQIFDDPAEALEYALTYGGTFKLDADLVLDDSYISVVQPGVTVTIDLNGYTITRNSSGEKVLSVASNASLTIIDTSIDQTGRIINSIGTAIRNDSFGTLIIESGTVIVESEKLACVENRGTFILNGGTVKGAPGVYNSGTFIMNGGTVSLIGGGKTIHNATGSTYTYNGGTVNGNVVGDNDTSQGEAT